MKCYLVAILLLMTYSNLFIWCTTDDIYLKTLGINGRHFYSNSLLKLIILFLISLDCQFSFQYITVILLYVLTEQRYMFKCRVKKTYLMVKWSDHFYIYKLKNDLFVKLKQIGTLTLKITIYLSNRNDNEKKTVGVLFRFK